MKAALMDASLMFLIFAGTAGAEGPAYLANQLQGAASRPVERVSSFRPAVSAGNIPLVSNPAAEGASPAAIEASRNDVTELPGSHSLLETSQVDLIPIPAPARTPRFSPPITYQRKRPAEITPVAEVKDMPAIASVVSASVVASPETTSPEPRYAPPASENSIAVEVEDFRANSTAIPVRTQFASQPTVTAAPPSSSPSYPSYTSPSATVTTPVPTLEPGVSYSAPQPVPVYGSPIPSYAYRPVAPLISVPKTIYVGRGIIGQPTVYVPGQPVRNFLRYLGP